LLLDKHPAASHIVVEVGPDFFGNKEFAASV